MLFELSNPQPTMHRLRQGPAFLQSVILCPCRISMPRAGMSVFISVLISAFNFAFNFVVLPQRRWSQPVRSPR